MSNRDRERIVDEASAATEKECRRLRIRCWQGDEYTPKAQEIFNRAYDHFEGLAAVAGKGKPPEYPMFLVLSGVGNEDANQAPENWVIKPCADMQEVEDDIRSSESNGAETVIVFKKEVSRGEVTYGAIPFPG